MKLSQIAGWLGVILILLAYTLTTLEVIRSADLAAGLLNLFGAIGIIISSYPKRDFQPVILNAVWLLVAIIGLIQYGLK